MVDHNFPDSSILAAKNLCRSPNHAGEDPWCFSTNPDEEWEFCGDVNKCKGMCLYCIVKFVVFSVFFLLVEVRNITSLMTTFWMSVSVMLGSFDAVRTPVDLNHIVSPNTQCMPGNSMV